MDEMRTMELIRELADKLMPGLKFTKNLPEMNELRKCPMLDIQVWVGSKEDHCTIRHTFFQKSVTLPLVFNAQGAHSWRSKLITLAEEMRRRFLHMDTSHTWEDQVPVLKDFIQ